MESIPAFVPAIALQGTAQDQHTFAAGFGPEHAGVFEALADHGPAAGFDYPRAAEQSGLTVGFIEHAVLMMLEVGDLAFQGTAAPATHLLEAAAGGGNDLGHAVVLEPVFPDGFHFVGPMFLPGVEALTEPVQMLQGMIEVQDFHRCGEAEPPQFPNPSRAVADEDDLARPSDAPASSLLPNADAKGFGGLEAAHVGGGGVIALGPAFLVTTGLGENRAQLDLAGFGGAIRLFAFAARQLAGDHGHAGAIDLHIQDGDRTGVGAWALFQLPRHLRSHLIDQTLDLPPLDFNGGQGAQVLTGPLITLPRRRPRRQAHQRR